MRLLCKLIHSTIFGWDRCKRWHLPLFDFQFWSSENIIKLMENVKCGNADKQTCLNKMLMQFPYNKYWTTKKLQINANWLKQFNIVPYTVCTVLIMRCFKRCLKMYSPFFFRWPLTCCKQEWIHHRYILLRLNLFL